MCHDANIFANPDVFNPDRFSDLASHKDDHVLRDGRDPKSIVFGFGRRYVVVLVISKKSLMIVLVQNLPGRKYC